MEALEHADECANAGLLRRAGNLGELEVVVEELVVGGPNEVLGEASEALHRLVDEVGILLVVRAEDELVEEGEEDVGDDLAGDAAGLHLVRETAKSTGTSVDLDVVDVVEEVGLLVASHE